MIRNDLKLVNEKTSEPSYNSYVAMEYLLDKLKLLNYEKDFLRSFKIKPLHKCYFAAARNSGEQFYMFCQLAFWLIRKTGKKIEQPEESDDPNKIIEIILNEVQQNGMQIDFAPSKLKQGIGEYAITILDSLTNQVLENHNITLEKLSAPEEYEEEFKIVQDQSEINLDRVEEEMIAAFSDDSDEENMFKLEYVNEIKPESLNVSELNNIHKESWKIEIEKVLPELKVIMKNDNRDWRSHLEQMKIYKNNIDQSLEYAEHQLKKNHKEISITLEKVTSREKYLNQEMKGVTDTYRDLQDQLSKIKENYRTVSSDISEKNKALLKLSDKLETLKRQMDEKGSSMIDGTPLINIKKSVGVIKEQIAIINVRIGVLQCMLLQAKIGRDKQLISEIANTLD